MKKRLQGIGAGLLLGGALLFSAGCAGVGYAGGGYYDYDYYPDWDVYFYPQGHLYYWNEAGHWRSGAHLPEHYALRGHHSEHFRGRTQQPWTEHHPAARMDERH